MPEWGGETPSGSTTKEGRATMQHINRQKEGAALESAKTGGSDRKRVEAVVETLAMVGNRGESLAAVAHDTRNMVTALGLYCDLLEEPGVLNAPFAHYAGELRLVAAASRRLVEKLVALDAQSSAAAQLPSLGEVEETESAAMPTGFAGNLLTRQSEQKKMAASANWETAPAGLIRNLAAELISNRNLLAALAGPGVALTVDAEGGALPVRLTAEDMTRILVNLVKNAAEAMKGSGRIQIALTEEQSGQEGAKKLKIAIEDSGPGIAAEMFEKIFDSGFTTHERGATQHVWTGSHRGLGLAITRSIVEAAGGSISAANRAERGARFEIVLPVESAVR